MFSVIRWIARQVGTYWDAISTVVTWLFPILGAAVSGWGAWANSRLAEFAPLSWIMAAIAGGLLCAIVLWLAAKGRYMIVQAHWANEISRRPDGVNPLDDSFTRKRIKLTDFVSSVHPLIERKVFDHCEIIGPCIVGFTGNTLFHDQKFFDSNFVRVPDNSKISGAIEVRDCQFIACKFYQLTVFIPENVATTLPPDVPWLNN